MDGDKTVQLGLVLAVYRGASMCSKGKVTKRRLRVCKPSISPLTSASCAAIRILKLSHADPKSRRFLACSVNSVSLLDPVGAVYLEVRPSKVAQPLDRPDILMVHLCDQGLREVTRLQKDPSLLDDPIAWNIEPPKDSTETAAIANKVYTYHDFSKSIQGTKNIVTFVRGLPGLWLDKGVEILDKNKKYKVSSGKEMSWESLAKRTPEFFETAFASSTSKEFGRLIILQLKLVLPDGGAEARQTKTTTILDPATL